MAAWRLRDLELRRLAAGIGTWRHVGLEVWRLAVSVEAWRSRGSLQT
jgi:hypothetical protein